MLTEFPGSVLYTNAAAFFSQLVEPELLSPVWINQVYYTGLFDTVDPKTIWLAKQLKALQSASVVVAHHFDTMKATGSIPVRTI